MSQVSHENPVLPGSSSVVAHTEQPEALKRCSASHFRSSYRPLDVEERGFRSFQIQTEKCSEPPDLTSNSPVWCLIFKGSRYTTFDMQISTLSPRHVFFFRIIKHQPSTTLFGEASANKPVRFFFVAGAERGPANAYFSFFCERTESPGDLDWGGTESKRTRLMSNSGVIEMWGMIQHGAERLLWKSESGRGAARIPLWMADLIVIHSEIWRKSVILSCQSIPAIRPAPYQPSEIYHSGGDERPIWSFLWCPHQSGPCLQVMMYSV